MAPCQPAQPTALPPQGRALGIGRTCTHAQLSSARGCTMACMDAWKLTRLLLPALAVQALHVLTVMHTAHATTGQRTRAPLDTYTSRLLPLAAAR